MGVGAGFPGTPSLPQDPPEKHLEKRRDLSGPAPFPAPITPASGLPASPFPFFSPLPLRQHSTLTLPLRGVGKRKGGWV